VRRSWGWWSAVAALILAVGFAAPARGEDKPKDPAAADAAKAQAEAQQKEGQETVDSILRQQEDLLSGRTFSYDPGGRRDPFRPPRVSQMLVGGAERTPLQRYELGQLRLVAVIYDTRDPRAVVEDDGGLGYIIRVGTKIGVNDGVVRGIERGRVLVEEESVDFFGEHRASEVVLEMASGERGNR